MWDFLKQLNWSYIQFIPPLLFKCIFYWIFQGVQFYYNYHNNIENPKYIFCTTLILIYHITNTQIKQTLYHHVSSLYLMFGVIFVQYINKYFSIFIFEFPVSNIYLIKFFHYNVYQYFIKGILIITYFSKGIAFYKLQLKISLTIILYQQGIAFNFWQHRSAKSMTWEN